METIKEINIKIDGAKKSIDLFFKKIYWLEFAEFLFKTIDNYEKYCYVYTSMGLERIILDAQTRSPFSH